MNAPNEHEFLAQIGAQQPAPGQAPGQPPGPPAGYPPQGAPQPQNYGAQAGSDTGPIPLARPGAHRADGGAPGGYDTSAQLAPQQYRTDDELAAAGYGQMPAIQQPQTGPARQQQAPIGEPTWNSAPFGGIEAPQVTMRAADLVTTEKIPSSHGWRKWLYRASFGKLNVGESADEIEVRKLTTLVKTPLQNPHNVVVLGGKGGIGKTTETAKISTKFAQLRTKDLVLAADADHAQAANLASRIVPGTTTSFKDVLAAQNIERNSDLRGYAGQNHESGLDVLAAHAAATGASDLNADIYRGAHDRLQRLYTLLVTDTGVDFAHAVMPGVLERADTVVLVASAIADGAEGSETALRWLWNSPYRGLLDRDRMVVVINHTRAFDSRRDRKETAKLVEKMVETFKRFLPEDRIFVMPYDRHVATAGVLDPKKLSAKTDRVLLQICAAIASGFGKTQDDRR